MNFDKFLNNNEMKDDLIRLLVEYEKKYQRDNGYDIRESITGPIVDMLYNSDTEKEYISELKDGIKFKFKYKSKIMRDFILRHETSSDHFWEPQTTKLLKYLSKNMKNVFVGGAYIGDHVVYIAKELESNNGRCYTFEPNVDSFNLLKDNCLLNSLSNVEFNNKGLWCEDKRLVFVGNDSHASSREAELSDEGEGFEAVSINKYCKDHNIEKIDLIMLDLEGGELNVLRGADKFLEMSKNDAPVVVFEIHSSYVDWKDGLVRTDIGAYLDLKGYSLYSIRDFQSNYPMSGRKIELISANTTLLDGPEHGFNIIAIKNEKILDDKNIVFLENLSPKLLLHRDKKYHFPIN
jgi:FkbM family methyltransferase